MPVIKLKVHSTSVTGPAWAGNQLRLRAKYRHGRLPGLKPTLSDQSEGEDERLQEDVKLTFESDPGYQHRDLPGLLLGRANQRL